MINSKHAGAYRRCQDQHTKLEGVILQNHYHLGSHLTAFRRRRSDCSCGGDYDVNDKGSESSDDVIQVESEPLDRHAEEG